ncbi:MAG: nucleotidyltransferase domain-containing protein [Planctomycetota bacterium]|nr:nucleotidyltransferase domain-containing protein [Planctomycetota bacterium]
MIPLVADNIDAIRLLCAKHRVKQLFLVGSALGDNFRPHESDIDFVVVFMPFERGGWDDPFFKLLAELQTLLGRPVDLLEAHTVLNPYLVASLKTKRELYAA